MLIIFGLKRFIIILLILNWLNNQYILAQELPPIVYFTPETHLGGNQNWAITQSEEGSIYVANNEGLLEFNGVNWHLYPSENGTIIRSVFAEDKRIYTGSYMDFGYYKKNVLGELQYYSLGKSVFEEMVEDEQFWGIKSIGHWLIFQSLNRIYLYDSLTEEISFIDSNGIVKMFLVDDTLYYQGFENGVFTIENGNSVKLDGLEALEGEHIINMFGQRDNISIITETNGFYRYVKNTLSKWNTESDYLLEKLNIYSAIQLEDKSFALGTISNGLLLIDSDGSEIVHFYQGNGMGNNTVLSLFEDRDNNVWVGLDNGVNLINLKSPFSIFNDDKGEIGAVYVSTIYKNNLYLGTNQGLFYRPIKSSQPFELVIGTHGQVWDLFVYDNTLFCGHNLGTFLVDEGESNLISNIPGTWNIKVLEKNTLIQGNYSGISVIAKVNGDWELKHKISGFDYSSRFLEIDRDNTLWVNHEYKGVFRLKLNNEMTDVIELNLESSVDKGKNSGLIKYNDKIIYNSEAGVFKYNYELNKFEIDTVFNTVYKTQNSYISGKMIVDQSENLWFFTDSSIGYFSKGIFNEQPTFTNFSIPSSLRHSVIGYENIFQIQKENFLLGTTNGYILIDNSELKSKNYHLYLNSLVTDSRKEGLKKTLIDDDIHIPFTSNTISLIVSVPEYDKFLDTEYQYKLDGYIDEWSEWTKTNTITFSNLSYGIYEFHCRSKTGDIINDGEVSLKFTINKPFYATNLAILIYLILGAALFLVIHYLYNRYYNKQKESLLKENRRLLEVKELESQKKIIQLRNAGLNKEIESRNRELAVATVSMIKKNEVLNSIKNELIKFKSVANINPIIRLIDKNINNKEDWEFFEEAFNHADKDYFKKVKNIHPQLTSKDLQLCVYLRLNLTSKEIAQLFNISPRSVEIKRYRLRKKLNLSSEINLNDYFINL